MNILNQQRLVERFEEHIRRLHLPVSVTWWDGRTAVAGGDSRVGLKIRDPRVLHTLLRPSLGRLARHYVEEQIDLDGDPRELTRVGEALGGPPAPVRGRYAPMNRWLAHTRLFDRKAIRYHYDVNDDFFGLWLDRRRVYSCAYFLRADDTLDEAQERKLDHICRKLMLQPGERFLDIGCGWGALVMWAAEHYGVQATGITLSQNQHDYARARIRAAGLEDRCRVQLMDYRDVPESDPYDKIASVGMFEHVGRKNLPVYFGKIQRLLKPGGLVMNHGITLNATDQEELGGDIGRFIDDYVFPGGELTHVSRVIAEMSAQGLESADVESLRPHYAKTLWHWVDRLEANRAAAVAKVGERAYRIWRIYMAGSAHAFERGWMSLYQILAGKAGNDGRLAIPLTRDYMYNKG
ncbi:MAG TPA: class I SAM-dependent methyltransferase [Burkholderiales bacterium]